ncbi:MAG: hypothetical protein RL095_2358 [Verrucomicrobiota bacterium]|jgi:hypothetical protein
MKIALSHFASRQLRPDFPGTRIGKEDLTRLIELCAAPDQVIPGYAPFAQILAIRNLLPDGSFRFPELRCLTLRRDEAFRRGAVLHTAYEARTPQELPVLVEWIEGLEAPPAPWIHVIVYSAEQMRLEGEDPGETDALIVSIATGLFPEPEPMRPITALRNALGVAEGGSGSPIDRAAYAHSVQFWTDHVMLRVK